MAWISMRTTINEPRTVGLVKIVRGKCIIRKEISWRPSYPKHRHVWVRWSRRVNLNSTLLKLDDIFVKYDYMFICMNMCLLSTEDTRSGLSAHWSPVMHICISELNIIGSDLNQCWNIINSNLRNRLQWNIKHNSYIFIRENAFE